MKALNKIIVSSLFALAFTACGDSSSSGEQITLPVVPNTEVTEFTDHQQCEDIYQNVQNVGIPGNTACPYKGAYNTNLGYQSYAFHYEVGIGFRIDFGWDYNDMCPEIGQRPIFQNGGFSHCSSVNPLFAQVDEVYYSQPNTGECAGDQLNTAVTGCAADLQPIAVPHFNTRPAPEVTPAATSPVLSI